MNEELTWERLHDATLVGLESSWESGEIIVKLKTGLASAPTAELKGFSGRLVQWPRKHPWGPSVSINEVRGPTLAQEDNTLRLEIEMQSGDTIVLEAAEFQLAAR